MLNGRLERSLAHESFIYQCKRPAFHKAAASSGGPKDEGRRTGHTARRMDVDSAELKSSGAITVRFHGRPGPLQLAAVETRSKPANYAYRNGPSGAAAAETRGVGQSCRSSFASCLRRQQGILTLKKPSTFQILERKRLAAGRRPMYDGGQVRRSWLCEYKSIAPPSTLSGQLALVSFDLRSHLLRPVISATTAQHSVRSEGFRIDRSRPTGHRSEPMELSLEGQRRPKPAWLGPELYTHVHRS